MKAPADRLAISLVLAAGVFLGSPATAVAQAPDNPAVAPPVAKPSALRNKARQTSEESADKSGPQKSAGAKGGASPMDAMKETAAPKPGAMPLGGGPTQTGKIGTEPTAKGKLGTPPDPDNKDRPPRPN